MKLSRLVKKLLRTEKHVFDRICAANNIKLDFDLNRSELTILQEVFEERVYSDYFPFYEKAIVIDIGGHYGYFSVFANRNLHPESKIYSFEPSKGNFHAFLENIKSNNIGNVFVNNVAIGEVEGQVNLNLSNASNHSIVLDYKASKRQSVLVKQFHQIVEEYNIDKIDFLKIDCEGAEYAILDSLEFELFQRIKIVSLEFHDLKSKKYNANYLIGLFRKMGFEIVKFGYNKTYSGNNYGKMIALNNKYRLKS